MRSIRQFTRCKHRRLGVLVSIVMAAFITAVGSGGDGGGDGDSAGRTIYITYSRMTALFTSEVRLVAVEIEKPANGN